ncbi:hypothetical protein CAC42_3039 [Sphaceloma murrayae]|uniref:Uncharacterized protein n=1 Tax=Sphaceloma murrayae TaxID=2082308 RepID=A0A2K1QRD3_9PEZI|nr:hypothetical protein CAC42_3039 [Sphaceloma murrayae]
MSSAAPQPPISHLSFTFERSLTFSMTSEAGSSESSPPHVSLVEFPSSPYRYTGTFRFLGLPLELRIIIYEIVFGVGYASVNNFIAAYVALIKAGSHNPRTDSPPSVPRTHPTILVVCKQVYEEAIGVLRQQTVHFHHGILDLSLRQLLTFDTLRNIRHLTITLSGHDILDKAIPNSFVGHRRLVNSLVDVLIRPGHKLQSLELHFDSVGLKWHLEHCWTANNGCDMRRWLESIYGSWKLLRNIPSVKIHGWLPENMKADLIRVMQSNYSPIDRLPIAVRARIFDYAASLSSVSRAINAGNSPQHTTPALGVPNILLINHRISREAVDLVRDKPLVLDFVNPPRGRRDYLHLYITNGTLRSIPHIKIHIRHRAWLPILHTICAALTSGHSVKTFELTFTDDTSLPASRRSAGLVKVYPDWRLEWYLSPLKTVRGVDKVFFGGDLALIAHGRVLRTTYEDMTGRPGPLTRNAALTAAAAFKAGAGVAAAGGRRP